MSKYGHKTHNWFEALVNKLGGEAAAEALLRDELVVSQRLPLPSLAQIPEEADYQELAKYITADGKIRLEDFQKAVRPKWVKKDGVIYFSVTSNGRTGPEWIAYFEKKGYRMGSYDQQLLCHRDFRPTNGVIYQVAVIKGMVYKDRNDRTTQNIRRDAEQRKLTTPQPEIACLIRDKFTDAEIQAMGLARIVNMHEPIRDSSGYQRLLRVNHHGCGRGLDAYWDCPDDRWSREGGFAFVVSSQVSA